jgi:hypothetical protein
MQIGTLTTGAAVSTTLLLTYVPQYITFTAATQLTSLKVTVLGDGVICDLDTVGLNMLGQQRLLGQKTNTYVIPIADGMIPNKNVEIIMVNSAAQTPPVFAINMQYGKRYIQSIRQTVLAASGTTFGNFAFLSLGNTAVNDLITVTYRDGLVQKVDPLTELQVIAGLYENIVNNNNYIIDNWQGNVRTVQFTPVATQVVHLCRVVNVGNVLQSS